MKRISAFVLILSLLISLYAPITVHAAPPDKDSPTLQLIDSTSFIDENGNIQYFCTDCPQSRHFDLRLHTHHVTNLRGPSRYSVYGGILAETEKPAEKDGTLGGSLTKTVSNSYSVDISFPSDTISQTVGYSVTYTQSSTASRTIDVKKGEMAQILYYDVYERTDFTALTNYYVDMGNGQLEVLATETGPGYSLEWKNFSYSENVYVP